jgi:phosphoglycerate dehydrogenase-like enzyme
VSAARLIVAADRPPALGAHLDGGPAWPRPSDAVVADGRWGATVEPGDVVVADYYADVEELRVAGLRGASWLHILSTGIERFPISELAFPVVTCSRGISGGPIAEFAMAAVLAETKRLAELWAGRDVAGIGELASSTLAIFGIGSIGRRLAALAAGFDMHVVALRRRPEPLPPELGFVRLVDDVRQLVEDADHVVVAAPLTAQTQRTFDRTVFGHMKEGSHLVNVSRGALVATDDLLAALDAGRPAVATLDVTDPEPLPADHPLRRHPRVRLSPHVAGRVPSAPERNWQAFFDNADRWSRGSELVGVVDREAGY